MKIHNPTSVGTADDFSGAFTGSFSGSYEGISYTELEDIPASIISSSAQINYSGSYDEILVKVVDDGGNKYQVDGISAPKLTLQRGHTYRFNLSDSTNSGHPLAFRTPGDGSHTAGVIAAGTPGSAGAYTQFHVGYDTPLALKYYCTSHGNGMGNSVKVLDGFGTELSDAVVISGSLKVTGDITAFSTSDERFKTNVTPILDSLSKIGEIKGYEYDWIESEHHDNTGHDIGVIAQEIEKIAPDAVVTRDNGYKAVRYEKLIPILIQAIKELSEKIDNME
tara:strand:+ start:258 stop:1094 length:837 start_codon:yes stop_codon:yes gene_type:complete